MRRPARLLPVVFFLTALSTACGSAPTTVHAASAAPPAVVSNINFERLEQLESRRAAAAQRAVELDTYLRALHDRQVARERAAVEAAVARQQARAVIHRPASRQPVVASSGAGSGRCGGRLPPCSVYRRESAMAKDPVRVWNGMCYYPAGWAGPNRCGSTASGKWQITRGTWAGFAGFLNAADAPVAVQDQRAEQLWAGGDGCSHWSAC